MLGRRVYLFVFLIFVNFVVGLLVADYGFKLLNFIALELFNKKDFYVFDTRNSGFGIFMQYSITTAFWLLFIYNVLCYWLYDKYQGIKFFLMISAIFVAYFCVFCLFFRAIDFSVFSYILHLFAWCILRLLCCIELKINIRQENDWET